MWTICVDIKNVKVSKCPKCLKISFVTKVKGGVHEKSKGGVSENHRLSKIAQIF